MEECAIDGTSTAVRVRCLPIPALSVCHV